jgi:hypothetical protein
MIPTQIAEPFHRDRWVYEEKGRRLAHPGLQRRRPHPSGQPDRRRVLQAVPGVAETVAALPFDTLVLDGEVAIFDQQLRSRFDWLRELDPDAVASPPLYMAFDLLHQDRRDPTARPLRDHRARLEDVVAGAELVFPVRRLAADGLAGCEGRSMATRSDS